jgi:hypothetical protein
MKRIGHYSATMLAISIALTANARAQRLSPDVAISNRRVYDVTITTSFVVPASGKPLSVLRVWHALPTPRPWDGLNRTLGASEFTFRPESGRIRYLAHNDSQHVFWEFAAGLSPGRKFDLASRFQVLSVDRTFDPKKSTAKWLDYGVNDYAVPAPPRFDLIEGGLELALAIDRIKKDHGPAEAALEFCRWIAENLAYDASVPFPPADLAAILNFKKGHCGHQMSVFEAMCARAGIPRRVVVGLNLNTPGGIGALHQIRPDYQNQHTWAEIYLPGSGWIEIDPGAGSKAYAIPAQLIQNNADFQNYVIWIMEDGTWKMPAWEYRDGKWSSPYAIENRRTFRRLETK